MTTRRNTIKKLALSSTALAILPAWAEAWTVNQLPLDTPFSLNEQNIMALVADTIIPTNDAPGALSVGVDKYLQQLFNDCYETEVQDKIKSLLISMDSTAQVDYGKSFQACDASQRIAILELFATSEDRKEVFQLIKSETIRGFRTSKEIMTKYYDYQVMPGHYFGCADVTNS